MKVLTLLLSAVAIGNAQNLATTQKVFSAAITTAQASAPLTNIGQSMHLLTVTFPVESSTVAPLQVRLEASFDQTRWFPISTDITSASLVGSAVYQIVVAFGPWPFVRVNSLLATPSSKQMQVYYSGHVIPTVPVVTLSTDRFLL